MISIVSGQKQKYKEISLLRKCILLGDYMNEEILLNIEKVFIEKVNSLNDKRVSSIDDLFNIIDDQSNKDFTIDFNDFNIDKKILNINTFDGIGHTDDIFAFIIVYYFKLILTVSGYYMYYVNIKYMKYDTSLNIEENGYIEFETSNNVKERKLHLPVVNICIMY